MENNPDIRDDVGHEEVTSEHFENILHYVKNNRDSSNTQLFSFLTMLNAYVPESYLLMSECQQILGPPDPIHGGPPFEERMEPFTFFISTSEPNPEHIRLINRVTAQRAVELLADLKVNRSVVVKKLIFSLCGNQTRPEIMQFIKDLLTKREMGEKGIKKFSRMIEDIKEKENIFNAVSVLKTASQKCSNPIYLQTLSRLYYIDRSTPDYEAKAERWARAAIKRAPNNSYFADTLGQIYKNRLRKAWWPEEVRTWTKEAFKAFKNVERKAEDEEGPEMKDTAGAVSISNSFNNRGLFGFMQVAKIAFEKSSDSQRQRLKQSREMEVEDKFDFFEWYLTYSKPDMTTFEPDYFWKVVALCYKYYTSKRAAESTSFPGLLDCLNHGLFMSKGRRAGVEEGEKNVSDLEEIQGVLKTTYEENVDDVKVAERYILSNIILSNKMPHSPHLTEEVVTELKTILHRFWGSEVGRRSPEFYLLVLLLFWPEERPELLQEETIQLPIDMEKCVTFMEKSFEREKYAKYLRGRYLVPLFFLGKGSGLSKWIHKSKLDAIVEGKVNAELAAEQSGKKMVRRINQMWMTGEVWQVPEIRDMLLPVAVEPYQSPRIPEEQQEVFVCVGGNKIKATIEDESDPSVPMLFYLGFTIRGPVVFKAGSPQMSEQ